MKMVLKFNVCVAVMMLMLTAACGENSGSGSGSGGKQEAADLVIENARIFTSDKAQPWAEALVVKDGKFIYVGDAAGLAPYAGATKVDLKGRLLFPGMVDGHSHPGYVNVENFGEVEGDTPEALLASVKAYAEAHPEDDWLRLCCWPTDMFVVGDQGPKKEALDAVLPDRLVWFESATAHDFWLNSKALERLGVTKDTPDPRPGLAMYARDENGEPSGWVKEGAGVQHFAKHFALKDEAHIKLHKDSVEETIQVLSRYGMTSIFDAGNKGYGDLAYGVVSQLEKDGKLPLRYYGTYQIFTPERAKTAISEVKRYRKEYGGELLKFNSVKLFMDGISANQSAAFLEPYEGDPGTQGKTMLSKDELRDLLLDLHAAKLDLLAHTIGGLAVRTVLDAVEEAQAEVEGDFYPRITMAHLVEINDADMARFEKLGVITNFTPWWFGVAVNDVVEDLLGEERYAQMYPAKSVFDSGARVTFSSDEWWGGDMLATYISPYLGMQVGHTRQYPKDWWETEDDGIKAPVDERLSLEQLLTGYTKNGAYQLRQEDRLGSIEAGKLADFVILDENLFEVGPYEISKIKPSAVVMEGKVIQGAFPE